jgi:hypothetical protein
VWAGQTKGINYIHSTSNSLITDDEKFCLLLFFSFFLLSFQVNLSHLISQLMGECWRVMRSSPVR